MDYEDFTFEDYDPEVYEFSNMVTAESWDGTIDDEWDPYGDWVYEGEYTDQYDQY